MSLYQNEITAIGETTFRNQRRRFGIKTDDRRRHVYLIGKTGMGKSTVLENMIIDDIRNGRGVGVVDPHGDLAEKILEYIPPHRINDVVYLNPADMEYPVAFNILETVEERYKHLVSSGLMGVFKKIWPDVWSARMEYILNNTLLALLDYPGSTMLGVNRMLSDKLYRQKVIEKIQDPVVKAFWVNDFASWNDKYASEAIAPVQNKVGQFLSASLIRNIVGQVKSSIHIREIMDNQKILIMNLSKGRIGEDNSRLLGGMLVTKIQLSAMERVEMPEAARRDFYLYVDEFQNFATESFANILSEARKYRLNLIVAHQYIEQLDEKVSAAVFGNVGTMIAFRVGASDADFLVKEFTPRFTEEDLVNIPKFNYYIKLMIDGVSSDPFSAIGLPPLSEEEKTGNLDKVIKVSRERYAIAREIVDDKIRRWTETMDQKEKERRAAEAAAMPQRPFAPVGRVIPPPSRSGFSHAAPDRAVPMPPRATAPEKTLSLRDLAAEPRRDEDAPRKRKRKKRPSPVSSSVRSALTSASPTKNLEGKEPHRDGGRQPSVQPAESRERDTADRAPSAPAVTPPEPPAPTKNPEKPAPPIDDWAL